MAEQYSPLARALDSRQRRGAVIGALTQGQGGQQLQRGPAPQVLQRSLNRDAVSDAQWAAEYAQKERELRADARSDLTSDIDKEVAALSKGMEDLAPVEQAFQGVQQMVARYGQEDIPGVGRIEGAPGFVGKTARLFQGDEAQLNFANVERLMATIRRNQIGSQQTQRELTNILQQVGQSGWESEAVFRDAVRHIGDAIEYEKRNIMTRATPEAVEVYNARFGQPASAPVVKPGSGTQIGRFTVEVE